jgi:hypothetical protein
MFKSIASAATVGLLALSVLSVPASANHRDTPPPTLGNSTKPAGEGQGGNGTTTTSTNKGNKDNMNCNDCFSDGPGNSSK